MMAVKKQISICSYNIKQYDSTKLNAIRDIFQKCSFMIFQETWLTELEFVRQFKNDFPHSECISSSKMDQADIKPGRPYGGVGICYHSNLKCHVDNIPTNSKSICGLKITIDNVNILLINVYMPSSNNVQSLNEYSSILQELHNICSKFPTHGVILGGDWNADPSRKDGRTQRFKDYIEQEQLINALNMDIANVPYTFKCMISGTESTLDHFLISPNLISSVSNYETLDMYNNFSDHSPIILSLNIDIESFNT